MTESKKRIPKRRFKEFCNTEDWEQCKLSKVINDIADGPFGSNLKTVHYTDAREARIIQLSNIGERGWQDENVRYTTFVHAKEIKRCIVQENELVMAKMMPAGQTIERPNADKMYVLSSDAVRIKLNDILVDSKFFVYMTKCNYFLDQINNDSQGSTRTRTSISKIKEMLISIPILQEQKKIGAFISSLDNLITLHQRKLDKMKSVKKAYLYEMFPVKGEKKPKRRFKGFTEDWVQYKLGELGSVSMCKRVFKDQTNSEGDVPFYKIGTFGFEPDAYISKDLFEEYKSKFSYPKNGSILISASGSIGRTVVFCGEDEYFQDSNIIWLEHNNRVIDPFLKHVYSIIEWSGIEGTTIKRLYNDNVLKTEIMLPSVEEQKAISSCFDKLDNQIALHQQKLTKLKKLKQAYLNEMFI